MTRKSKVKTYIVKSDISPLYKIGKTRDVKSRMIGIRGSLSWVNIELIREYDKDVESFLHNEFRHSRITGEWFLLSDKDIARIDELVSKTEGIDEIGTPRLLYLPVIERDPTLIKYAFYLDGGAFDSIFHVVYAKDKDDAYLQGREEFGETISEMIFMEWNPTDKMYYGDNIMVTDDDNEE